MRDHEPVVIEEFNGLWQRGGPDSTPPDHFADCNNIKFIESGFQTRDGIQPFAFFVRQLGIVNMLRMYTFNTSGSDGLITLDTSGTFWHVIPQTSQTFPIVQVIGATDFTMAIANGRAYINPFSLAGLQDFIYVYNGVPGTTARQAGGNPPVGGGMAAANGAAGSVELGTHVFGVVYETDSGFLTQIGPTTLPTVVAPGGLKVNLTGIPTSPSAVVVARHIVATKAIQNFNGNTRGYEFFFVPNGEINNNVATTLTVDFFDIELLDSASNLLDIRPTIHNGIGICLYHNRLVVVGQGNQGINVAIVSNPGEYEAFNAVDGLITAQDDGLGLTAGQEYRDILYIFKINETLAFVDNGDVPSSWPVTIIDDGLGAGIHGIGYTNARQGMSSEFLLIQNISGVYIFNGVFQRPELSYKIKNLWLGWNQDVKARVVQIYDDVLHQIIYLNNETLLTILVGDYSNGMTPELIRWTRWTYNIETTTITLFDRETKLLIGASQKNGGLFTPTPSLLHDTVFNNLPAPPLLVNQKIIDPFVLLYPIGD